MTRRRIVLLCGLAMATVLFPAAPASADHLCDVAGPYIGCGTDGHGAPPPAAPKVNPWQDYNKGWGGWTVVSLACESAAGPAGSPRLVRFLRWTEGALRGSRVHKSDFGGYAGAVVPNAPRTSAGRPARFSADGLSWDGACGGDPIPSVEVSIRRAIPAPETGRNPSARGLTGLETWLWYEGDVVVPEFGTTWREPLSGVSFEVEARGFIEDYEWSMGDGTVVRASAPGSAASLPETAAARHVYERKAVYDLALTVTWRGEYRLRRAAPAGPWSVWFLMPSTWDPTVSFSYEVAEIRSSLEAQGG